MQKTYIVYNVDTGKILRSGTCQDAEVRNQAIYPRREDVLADIQSNDVDNYVDIVTKNVIWKDDFPIAQTESGFENIPPGTLADTGNASGVVNDGVLILQSDLPQAVRVVFTHVKYKTMSMDYEINGTQ